jgi:colicin import membrane protein
LPQHQNSNREPLTKERKQGLVISAVTHIIIAILIIFVSFKVKMPEPVEEGLLVNFGYDETGEGLYEPAPVPEAAPVPPPSSGDEGAADDAILTQDFEEAVEIKKKEPDPEQLKREAEARAAEIRRREEAEAERRRIEQETAERLKREEEQRRLNEIKDRTRNAFGNAGNTGTAGQSEGVAGGQGNQGVESGTEGVRNYGPGGGTGNSNISYDLAGRRHQSLPLPKYDYQGEGRVVVEVTVDRSGTVTKAIAGVKGSTTLDEYLLRVAREAALKAKFDSNPAAPVIQKGTITYNFRLK